MRKFLLAFSLILLLVPVNECKAEVYATYVVAGDKYFPPYEYVDEDGVYRGFNVDIIKAIGLVNGMEFEFRPMKWEDAYHSIENTQADIIQGMKESEERKEKFLFTDSLLTNSQSIFVLVGDNRVRGLSDLRNKSVAINVEDISYKEISKIDGINIIQYESISGALDALLRGDVEVFIGNTLTVNYLCKENNSLDKIQIVGESLNESKYSMAVAKDNYRLLDKLNSGIQELQRNGMYDSLYRKWFGAPIRNTRVQNEGLLRLVIIICFALIIALFIFQRINTKLNDIIAQKTEEQRLIINELRRYDKMQFMDKIISSIAHEIRNPMTSIKLYVSQMGKKLENKEFMLAASEDIKEEVERIEGLITEFVEYTSPRKAIVENLNLNEEITNALSFIKLQFKNVIIEKDVSDHIYIEFDKSHLRQILLNIFLNSVDAVKDSEYPLILIKGIEGLEDVKLLIKDNGYGMKAEDVEYIFEPFYTTKEYGNGVGMFVVKQIVEENGGVISVFSDGVGKGMEIIISMNKGEYFEE